VDWHLKPGDSIRRSELHDRYGGGRQGGIAPCTTSPNVLIFTDRSVGDEHGYHDRWDGDVLEYCGEGQRGDQVIARGNRAIRDHREDGRALRVFQGVRGMVQYTGEYELESHRWAEAPGTGGGSKRRVIMFRLRPVGRTTE
jgi:hypothetical protein